MSESGLGESAWEEWICFYRFVFNLDFVPFVETKNACQRRSRLRQ